MAKYGWMYSFHYAKMLFSITLKDIPP